MMTDGAEPILILLEKSSHRNDYSKWENFTYLSHSVASVWAKPALI